TIRAILSLHVASCTLPPAASPQLHGLIPNRFGDITPAPARWPGQPGPPATMESGPGPAAGVPPSSPAGFSPEWRKESSVTSQALLAARALSSASSDTLDSVCADKGQQPGIACRLAWDILHNRNAAELVKVWLAQPASAVLRVAFLPLIAVQVRPVSHR